MDLKKIDKKLYLYFGIGFGVMIFLIIVILIINLMFGGRVSYKVAEEKMLDAAIKYYSLRQDQLPSSNEVAKVTIEELVNAKLIKSFDRLLKDKEATCAGYVTVKNNNGYYLYSPYIDCGNDYKTNKLTTQIKSDNKTVTAGDGLYQIGDEFVFRGEAINNYISFANKLWRIIKINSDGSIRMIELKRDDSYVWDDRYNTDVDSNNGINDYRVSRIKDTVNSIYNDSQEFNDTDKSFIISQNICLGKQTEDSSVLNGSIECSDILENQYASLLQVNEYVIASIDNECNSLQDKQCSNYNYMATFPRTFWTITASSEKSDYAFKINGTPTLSKTANASAVQLVIHISGDVIYDSGNGSEENPYTIKMTK